MQASYHSQKLSGNPASLSSARLTGVRPTAQVPTSTANSGNTAVPEFSESRNPLGLNPPVLRSAFFAFPHYHEDAVVVEGNTGELQQAAPGVSAHWMPGRMQLAVGGGRASSVWKFLVVFGKRLSWTLLASPCRFDSGTSPLRSARGSCQRAAAAGLLLRASLPRGLAQTSLLLV